MVEGMSLLASTFRSAYADDEQVSRSTVVRALAMAALAPIVTGVLVTAALLTLILAIATSSHFSTAVVLSTTGPVWLAAYQVPLEIGGQPLGVLPLLPTLLVCVLIARAVSGAAQRLGCSTPDRGLLLIGVVAGVHAVAGVAAAISAGDAFITVDVFAAGFVPALVSGLAATAGVAKPCGLATAVRRYLDPIAVAGLRAGALGLAGLIAAGGLTLLLATALSVSTVADLFAELAPGAGSGTGLWLLSLGYVPNAVVMAMGFVTGPGLQLGSVEIGPFSYTGGGVPPFPLLGALPDEQALWWPVLMLLPAAVGAGVGWSLRACHEDPMARLRTVGVAGALVGFAAVVAGFLAGGRLAAGAFDPVGIPLGVVSIAAFLWIAVPGALVAWFAGPRPAAHEDDGDADDTDDVGVADDADRDDTGEDGTHDADTDGEDADTDTDDTDDTDGIDGIDEDEVETEDGEDGEGGTDTDGTDEDADVGEADDPEGRALRSDDDFGTHGLDDPDDLDDERDLPDHPHDSDGRDSADDRDGSDDGSHPGDTHDPNDTHQRDDPEASDEAGGAGAPKV